MFGSKQFPHNAGYPTPEDTPTESTCLTLNIPANSAWWAIYTGLLLVLTEPEAWQQMEGGMSKDDAAADARIIFDDAMDFAATENTCNTIIDAPYWDETTADDADDTAPAETQTWYGDVTFVSDELTFAENLQIWVIAGFVAFAATPLAALTFIPIAQRFTLAFKQHDLGGIIRVFVDAIEVNQVDTYAPSDGVVTTSVVMPVPTGGFIAEDTPHSFTLVMSEDFNPAIEGTPNIQILRQRLTIDDFSPPSLRYNPDTDTVQYTPDGGTTWTDAPESDPRHSMTLRLPPLTTSDVKCDSAANMVKWLHDFLDQVIAAGALASEVLLIVNLFLQWLELLTGFFSVILSLITEAAEIIATIGSSALDAAFSSDQYDLLLCIFYCNMDSDGSVSAAQLADIETDVSAQLNTTAALVTNLILGVQGETGLTNAGRVGSETGDCSGCDCGWCFEVDLTVDDFGIVQISGCPFGTWVSGSGWRSDSTGGFGQSICLHKTFTATEITKIELTSNFQAVPGGIGAGNYMDVRHSGSVLHTFTQTPSDCVAIPTMVCEFDDTIDEIVFNPSGAFTGGNQIYETHIKLFGFGTCPFGTPNC